MPSQATTVIDGQTASSGGGTVSDSYDVESKTFQNREGVGYAVIVEGDSNGGNLDLDVRGTFNGVSGTVNLNNSYTGLDATTNHVARYPSTEGAATLEIEVTNQAGSDSVVSVYVVPYKRV